MRISGIVPASGAAGLRRVARRDSSISTRGARLSQAVAEFLQGVHLHVAAVRAGAAVGGAGDEVLVRAFLAQAVEHAALGDDDDVLDRCVLAVGDHFLGRADFVGEQSDGLGAFRVGDDEGVGILVP